MKYWDGSRVEAEATERRRQLPFCLAPSTVALILALVGVARLAEIATDIGTALRALANAKIHSNAAHSSISTVSQVKEAAPKQFAQEIPDLLKFRSSNA